MTKDELRTRLVDYLRAEGVEVKNGVKPIMIDCVHHSENNASMQVNTDKNYVYCHGCKWSGDVFKIAGLLHDISDFKLQLERVAQVIGVELDAPKKEKTPRPVPISEEKAKEIFNKKYFQDLGERCEWGDFTTGWMYRNATGEVDLIDVRYDKPDGKNIVTFYYDGQNVKSKKAPVRLYNRDLLKKRPNAPILIVEGCKAAHAAAALEKYIPVTWNGGGSKVGKVLWTPLRDREVIIYPDDDQQVDKKTGELMPEHEQPGIKAALEIKERLPDARIVRPPIKARSVKPSGADVVDALEVMTAAELTEYLDRAEEIIPPPILTPEEILDAPENPFRVLGTDDYGIAYFVGRNERLWDISLKSITKTQLMDIAPLSWWKDNFPSKTSVDWDTATDYTIEVSTSRDFDTQIIRGRGAWSDEEGRTCYHDGKDTIGYVDPKYLYIRKTKKDIGLGTTPAALESLREIDHINGRLTYKTPMDAVRLLAWATIAPFAGALPWRPAILVTGPSGSGKSEILDLVTKPLSDAHVFSGGETTEAGVRQCVGNDSCAIIIEESEAESKKKKFNRDALFSMMRQSTSNDAPRVAKGSLTGRSVNYSMRSMFCFLAIDPTIEYAADENRIFRIDLIKATESASKNYRETFKPTLKRTLTPNTTRAIRSLVWREFKKILNRAHTYADIIQEVSGKDSRYSLAEGILQSVYWHIWRNSPDLEPIQIARNVADLYSGCPPDDPRDEAAEVLDRILDRKVQIEKPQREHVTIREICYALKHGAFEHQEMTNAVYSNTLSDRDDVTHLRGIIIRHGVSMLDKEDLVAIDVCSEDIMKALDLQRGYSRQLLRHENALAETKIVHMAGKSRRCVLVKNIMDEKPKEDKAVREGEW